MASSGMGEWKMDNVVLYKRLKVLQINGEAVWSLGRPHSIDMFYHASKQKYRDY